MSTILCNIAIDIVIFIIFYIVTSKCKTCLIDCIKTIYKDYRRNDIFLLLLSLCLIIYKSYYCVYCK